MYAGSELGSKQAQAKLLRNNKERKNKKREKDLATLEQKLIFFSLSAK